jgi:inorganic pyrophosphatase
MPRPVVVCIEVPKGSFVKREADRGVEFLSPIPCPFNYGYLPGHIADDGDPPDALVLGPPLSVGESVATIAWQRVRFVDDGSIDDKLICGAHPPDEASLQAIRRFFAAYALARSALNLLKGRKRARYLGIAALTGETR